MPLRSSMVEILSINRTADYCKLETSTFNIDDVVQLAYWGASPHTSSGQKDPLGNGDQRGQSATADESSPRRLYPEATSTWQRTLNGLGKHTQVER